MHIEDQDIVYILKFHGQAQGVFPTMQGAAEAMADWSAQDQAYLTVETTRFYE